MIIISSVLKYSLTSTNLLPMAVLLKTERVFLNNKKVCNFIDYQLIFVFPL